MGFNSLFKKKENQQPASQQTSLPDELPPLPDQFSQNQQMDMGPSPDSLPQPSDDGLPNTLTEPSQLSEAPLPETQSSPEINLDTSSEPIVQEPSFEVTTPNQPQQLEKPSTNNAKPSSQSFDELPGFDEKIEQSSDEELPVTVRSESLLLKNIFVEREHYATMLFSIKEMKDDLQSHATQHRKLSATDLKLSKSFMKLSNLFEQSHENFMTIESIIARDNV